MIRFLFRFLGLMCLAGAFILLIYDGTKSIAGNTVFLTTVENLWNALYSPGLVTLKRHIADWSLSPVAAPFFAAPSWLALAIFGVLLILLGRKKKPLIGYAR